MRNDRLPKFEKELIQVLGRNKVLTDQRQTAFYTTGIRVGSGSACAVVFPDNLLQLWISL